MQEPTAVPVSLRRSAGLPETACYAPSVQLFLLPSGDVVPCARHLRPLGNVTRDRLLDIWDGSRRAELRRALAGDDYSLGCENCGAEATVEGTARSYASFFETRAQHLAEGPGADRWPRFIDFNLSSVCNLQCLQCSGELSSAIRIHREKRPPLPLAYDDTFLEDLRAFIPHLDQALFAGGEPFLAAINYEVWDLIAELRPDLPITVTTNATQWNDRVEAVLEKLRFSFVISLDGIRSDTYAAIRVGGELEPVLDNIERFESYARRRGTSVSVNHCLMIQNHHEFADLLVWAEGGELDVKVSVVRTPSNCSISSLSGPELIAVHSGLMARDDEMHRLLHRNLETWTAEVERIGAWATNATAAEPDHVLLDRRVLTLRVAGAGPTSDAAARHELGAMDATGEAHVLTVGLDGVITSCSPGFAVASGIPDVELVGRHADAVSDVTQRHLGPVRRHEVLHVDDDRRDLAIRFGTTDVRIAMLAMRDASGTATHGRLVLAFRPAVD